MNAFFRWSVRENQLGVVWVWVTGLSRGSVAQWTLLSCLLFFYKHFKWYICRKNGLQNRLSSCSYGSPNKNMANIVALDKKTWLARGKTHNE